MSSRFRFIAAVVLGAVFAAGSHAAESPGSESTGTEGALVVIEAGRVITVTGEEYAPGQVVIEDGKIILVGQKLDVPRSARRIRAPRETVMPGLILARTRFGLASYPRSGLRGDAKGKDELHAGEIDQRPLQRAGFVAAAYVPAGTGMPGQASVVAVGGDGVRVIEESAYLPFSFVSNARDRKTLAGAFDKAKKEIEKVDKARAAWEKKQAEAKKKAEAEKKPGPEKKDDGKKDDGKKDDGKKAPPPADPKKKPAGGPDKASPTEFKAPPIDPTVAPLVPIIKKEKNALPLVFEIGGAGNFRHLQQVLEDLDEVRESERQRNILMVPSARTEQRAIVEDLGKWKATVITVPMLSAIPQTRTQLNLPGELAAAGCRLVFLPASDTELEFLRLRSRVAELVRTGLSREDGLKALTHNPAQFLRIADRYGSIEKGRVADLIFLDGDPLAAATEVTRTMVDGKIVWEREASR